MRVLKIVEVYVLKVNVFGTTDTSFLRRPEFVVEWHCGHGVDSRLRGNDGVFL